MNSANRWSGVFAILASPFDENGHFVAEGLARQVDLALAWRIPGVVFPGIASEVHTLSAAERKTGVEAIVRRASGQLKVVAGVSAADAQQALDLVHHAVSSGADGIMAMPSQDVEGREVSSHFEAIAELAAGCPMLLQSAPPPLGKPLSASQIAQTVNDVAGIRYVKQEADPIPHAISETLERVGGSIDGVFGGAGGLHVVEEFRRGTIGSMPGIHLADVVAEIWQACEAGDEDRARSIHRLLLPAVIRAATLGPCFAKTVLVRRAVLESWRTRGPSVTQDSFDVHELELILETLRPFMRTVGAA